MTYGYNGWWWELLKCRGLYKDLIEEQGGNYEKIPETTIAMKDTYKHTSHKDIPITVLLRVKTDDCDYSAYMNITPEENLRRLAYCIKLLPSPLYKTERLMPTNPQAQKQYLIKEEEQPRPSIEKTERQERSLMMIELCKYLEEEEESTEEKTKKRREKIQRVKTIKIKNFTRRRRIRQSTIRQYVDQHMRGKKNIIWTILLKPLGC
ncbi:uncharacterized protein LOC142657480 [Rhinoderma darwinii]|uniref:uncharacterized protein LOC142657480 n=1 Tax=Rhinoderma darwinii TaxID=43563 RepID=UPI003F672F5D